MDITRDIHASGLKVTAARQRILELFHASPQQHLTAEDVYRLLWAEHKDFGMATVYRVLMQFVAVEILVRNQFENSPARFELNTGKHHDHMICTRCGRVEEFVDPDIERRQHAVAQRSGFALVEHTLSLYGQCRHCGSERTTPA
ncbi:Fur family transcriptional regulator [Pseudoduganella violaceinigra]|uniref:Fur family transcriptional regulator n=1 Tax=Pseudoduganella violaceinigra TaxID=246602 RepID=UPI0004874607|nr:transcriptional repressor [Pseudoduganella violaceinigra]